jgi:hypothetical protein
MGDDGQVAVLAAQLYAENAIDLLGFTIPSGNQWRDQEVSDCLKAVKRLGIQDKVKVYVGAYSKTQPDPKNLVAPPDGFAKHTKPAEEDAVDFIIDTVHRYPHEVTILALGPFTNVALAMRLDPTIIPSITDGNYGRPDLNCALLFGHDFHLYCERDTHGGFDSVGMTFVLIIGGIDLSVGSVLAVSGGVLGIAMVQWQWSVWTAMIACVLVGAFCGLINGALIVRFRLPSFIVTLGLLEAARGAAYLVTNSQTQYIGAEIEQVNDFTIFGLSLPFFVSLIVVVIAQLVLTGTIFGRYLIAIGTNEEAARLSGIDPRPIKIIVFMISGTLSGLAAVAYCARLASVDPGQRI